MIPASLPGAWFALAVRVCSDAPEDAGALVVAAYDAGLTLEHFDGIYRGVGRFAAATPPTLVFLDRPRGAYALVHRGGVCRGRLDAVPVKPGGPVDA